VPLSPFAIEDRCTLVELNHVYDPQGGLIFDQVIWWEWNPLCQRLQVVDWRLAKGCRICEADAILWRLRQPNGPPYVPEFAHGHCVPLKEGKRYVSRWWDEKDQRYRVVIADGYRETWSSCDPELLDREVFPVSKRRGFSENKNL
jgi:hypothetical protein